MSQGIRVKTLLLPK